MQQCDERSLLPFYVRLDISCVYVIPMPCHVVCGNEVLGSQIFSLFCPFGSRTSSLEEEAAPDKYSIKTDACQSSDCLVAADMFDNSIPDSFSVCSFELFGYPPDMVFSNRLSNLINI